MQHTNWDEVRRRRLQRQGLLAAEAGLTAAARATCGIHAQVHASAELQLAERTNGSTQADVRTALWERRSLVKAWTVRGTLHLHPAGELALWFGARRAVSRASPHELEGLEAWRDPAGVLHPRLGPDDVSAIRAAVWDALDGRCLLRQELAGAVVERVGLASQQRFLSGFAFFFDELCQGPPQGAKVTLVRPDQWIEGWHDMDEQTALLEACRRYLRTYGPARPRDFREWFGSRALTDVRTRGLFESLGAELEEIVVDGHRSFVLAGDIEFPEPAPSVKLLPEYDVYVMGFREREQLVPLEARERLLDHARGKYEGPAAARWLVVDGVAAGMWERKKRARRIELTVEPFVSLSRAQRSLLGDEAERIGAFYGLEPELAVTDG